jgi:hypothetical protein
MSDKRRADLEDPEGNLISPRPGLGDAAVLKKKRMLRKAEVEELARLATETGTFPSAVVPVLNQNDLEDDLEALGIIKPRPKPIPKPLAPIPPLEPEERVPSQLQIPPQPMHQPQPMMPIPRPMTQMMPIPPMQQQYVMAQQMPPGMQSHMPMPQYQTPYFAQNGPYYQHAMGTHYPRPMPMPYQHMRPQHMQGPPGPIYMSQMSPGAPGARPMPPGPPPTLQGYYPVPQRQ